jgi:phospholipid-binding lipoprotein MlaA
MKRLDPGTDSNLHSKWHLGGKDEAPEAYTQYVEEAEDEANDSDTMNANWNDGGRMHVRGFFLWLPVLLIGLSLSISGTFVLAANGIDAAAGTEESVSSVGNPTGEIVPVPVAVSAKTDEYGDVREEEHTFSPAASTEKSSDEYGNVAEEVDGGEEPHIADPIEPWNRAMYHINDKFYFWLLSPTAKAYKFVVPEDFRGLFANLYRNLKAPVRIVNNFLQGKIGYAGRELAKFLINSTIGVGGLRDCATECFGIKGRDADFGQTLGKYGVGPGFYIVWPLLGPSSPRDTVGWVADRALTPTTYASPQTMSPEGVGLFAHETVNSASFHLGDYEALKGAAIDPYVAMRDAYVQYRKKMIEE